MLRKSLLVELVTEELPPKALPRLAASFAEGVVARLQSAGLMASDAPWRWFATPRRLAVWASGVGEEGPTREALVRLMPVAVAYGADGSPTPALTKRLAAKGLTPETAELVRDSDGKQEMLFLRERQGGARLMAQLAGWVDEALMALPIPKRMRWGSGDATFVRPVHRLVMLWGEAVVPGHLFGLTSGRETLGHRFLSRGAIDLASADAYEPTLLAEGKVIPDFAARREAIAQMLADAAAAVGCQLRDDPELLDEVTALVEYPAVYRGAFPAEFLAVPPECLILTMRANQKYFPLFDGQGQLTNQFLIVSNMRIADPSAIIRGNERVVRPRLSDARFFYEQDRKVSLESRLPRLAAIVYHNRIGTLAERVERLQALAGTIAERLGVDPLLPQRAARLAKCDLVTEMVGEFPELQGVMGRYYALADGEPTEVAEAIEDHYKPRFAGDLLPRSLTGTIVALADKLDALAGLFAVGEVPTGEKDPFALRRAALGVVRMVFETPLPLDVDALLAAALAVQPQAVHAAAGSRDVVAELRAFIDERLRNWLRDKGQPLPLIDAVLAIHPQRLDTLPARLAALAAFAERPEAARLATARKRVVNLLKRAEGVEPNGAVDVALFAEPAEKQLFDALVRAEPYLASHVANEAFEEALAVLAELAAPIDAFFDGVMVLCDEPLLRANRLALLTRLKQAMDLVADLSVLAA